MKNLKGFLVLVLCLGVMLTVVACGGNNDKANGQEQQSNDEQSVAKIGVVFTTSGLGDKNFNDMAFEGIERAKDELNITYDYVEPKAVSDFITHYRMLSETEQYDLIIGIGLDQVDAVTEIKQDFPEQKITIIDSNVEIPNVRSITTDWTQQTFLTGVIAGLETNGNNLDKVNDDNVIGVILGKDFPNLREGAVGFKAGATYVNPDIEVLDAVIGDFSDPSRGKEVALSMYNRGADFIQHIAGGSGLGVFNAAKESDRYAFGVGNNQNSEDPDYIAASATRNVGGMVFNEVKHLLDDENWDPGLKVSGIKEGAVGYEIENSNVNISQETIDIVEEIKEQIISGELTIPKTDEEIITWKETNKYIR